MSCLRILFDLQEYLSEKPLGELIGDIVLLPYGANHPALFVEQAEDVRIVRVNKLVNNDTGVEINLTSIKSICSGDRIIVMGRFGQLALNGAKIALFSTKERDIELACHELQSNLYSLSYLMTNSNSQSSYLSLCTTSASLLGVDFFIDGILVVREE